MKRKIGQQMTDCDIGEMGSKPNSDVILPKKFVSKIVFESIYES